MLQSTELIDGARGITTTSIYYIVVVALKRIVDQRKKIKAHEPIEYFLLFSGDVRERAIAIHLLPPS